MIDEYNSNLIYNKSTLNNSLPPLLDSKSLRKQGQIIDVKCNKSQKISHYTFFFSPFQSKIIFPYDFCLASKIVIIAEIFFINFLKTLINMIKRATINFNKEQLKPKNHFSRLFKIFFSNSRLFKALKTIF